MGAVCHRFNFFNLMVIVNQRLNIAFRMSDEKSDDQLLLIHIIDTYFSKRTLVWFWTLGLGLAADSLLQVHQLNRTKQSNCLIFSKQVRYQESYRFNDLDGFVFFFFFVGVVTPVSINV